jgi:hypothetical protein
VQDAKAVGEWARGERTPRAETELRLRDVLQIVELLAARESPETIRAWFRGMNPYLDDTAPALAIADNPRGVLQAARAFLAYG